MCIQNPVHAQNVQKDKARARMLVKKSKKQIENKEYDLALKSTHEAYTLIHQHTGDRNVNTAILMVEMGGIYLLKEDHDMAQQWIERGLKVQRWGLGNEHPLVGQSVALLGKVYIEQKKYDSAEQALLEAEAIFQKKYPIKHATRRGNFKLMA
ncbi:MAG: tetratricopeptide repeat protein, partial [Myxococcota bacterium]